MMVMVMVMVMVNTNQVYKRETRFHLAQLSSQRDYTDTYQHHDGKYTVQCECTVTKDLSLGHSGICRRNVKTHSNCVYDMKDVYALADSNQKRDHHDHENQIKTHSFHPFPLLFPDKEAAVLSSHARLFYEKQDPDICMKACVRGGEVADEKVRCSGQP